MQNIACLYTNLILLLKKAKKKKRQKRNLILVYFLMTGEGSTPSLLCTAEAACTVLASLSHFSALVFI